MFQTKELIHIPLAKLLDYNTGWEFPYYGVGYGPLPIWYQLASLYALYDNPCRPQPCQSRLKPEVLIIACFLLIR
jgi:hypothetical protein